jgi:hypothetical protein
MVSAGQNARNSAKDPWEDETASTWATQAVGALCQPGIAYDPAHLIGWVTAAAGQNGDSFEEHLRLTDLLRDIFGNPFRPVSVEPHWLTPTVRNLAAAIYAGRAFDRLPVLADALEDAGCDNADVLTHCRGPGPHVRGCWVVDLLLGKT